MKIIKKNEQKGYISIETALITGIILFTGVLALMAMQANQNTVTTESLNSVDGAVNNAVILNPYDN
ncbi:MAG: hypothetical protein GX889_05020 [Clostridiales bacterium]|nr:hypothetical protein [Clostridiales bacterium]